MPKVIIADNPMLPDTWCESETDDCATFIMNYFKDGWPATAKIYKESVVESNDITPSSKRMVKNLQEYQGTVWVIVYPGEASTILFVASIVISIALTVYTELQDDGAAKKVSSGSPNNVLGAAANRQRLGQRVPDIVGAVRSVPDIVAEPLIVYEDGRQVEILVTCVGRGENDVGIIRDGDTLVENLFRMSAEVYGPFEMPNSTTVATIQSSVGEPINEVVKHVFKASQVDGIEMHPWNEFTHYFNTTQTDPEYGGFFDSVIDNNQVNITKVDIVPGGAAVFFRFTTTQQNSQITDVFRVNDKVHIKVDNSNGFLSFQTDHVGPAFDESPTAFTVVSFNVVDATHIDMLCAPHPDDFVELEALRVNLAGQQLSWDIPGYSEMTLTPIRENSYTEQVVLSSHDSSFEFSNREVVCNFLMPQGLNATDGNKNSPYSIRIEVTVKEGAPNVVGTTEVVSKLFTGNAASSDAFGETIRVPITFTGACTVQARINTLRRRNSDEVQPGLAIGSFFSGRLNDTVTWTHCYDTSEPVKTDMGDVTLMMTKVRANDTTRKVKNREISCTATRRVRLLSGGAVGSTPTQTTDFHHMVAHVLMDPLIGNYSSSNIDIQGLEDVFATLNSHFNTLGEHTKFGHTFDDLDSSVEEIVNSICNANFCTSYREGDIFKVREDVPVDTGALILNHRNIIPKSQSVQHMFGIESEADSIEVPYVNNTTGVFETVVVPDPLTNTASLPATFVHPRKTRKVSIAGILSKPKALAHALRIYNKALHGNQIMTLNALEEAALLINKDRVLVADRTRTDSQDGFVVQVSGLTIVTSQPVDLSLPGGHTIFFQHSDGTTESMDGIVAGVGEFQVVLPQAPSNLLVTDEADAIQTNYLIVNNLDARPNSFLLQEKNASSPFVFSLEMVNYNHFFYSGDSLVIWIPFYVSPALNSLNKAPSVGNPSPPTFFGTGLTGNNTRGLCWSGNASNRIEVPLPAIQVRGSYSKAAWLRITAPGSNAHIISSQDSTTERFEQVSPTLIIAGHTGTSVSYDFSAEIGDFHHFALVYDRDTTTMKLFRDGVLVDEDNSVPNQAGNVTIHRVFSNMPYPADEPMMWNRALSNEEMKHVYQSTIRSQDWVGTL